MAISAFQTAYDARCIRLSRLCGGNLGAKLIYDLCIVGVKSGLYHNESVSVGLAEEIFRFVYFVSGIDSYKHRAYLCSCPERYIPSGEVGCPNSNLGACLYSERNERSCKAVNVLAEFGIGSRIIKSCVFKTILVTLKYFIIFLASPL